MVYHGYPHSSGEFTAGHTALAVQFVRDLGGSRPDVQSFDDRLCEWVYSTIQPSIVYCKVQVGGIITLSLDITLW